jgi:BioD-like phosphotransacetylase family protein
MPGLYIGSTSGYAGKNLLTMALGLRLQKEGYKIGYMKPVGFVPSQDNDRLGDEDAFFIQEILGLDQDPALVTPVLFTQDFKVQAFSQKPTGLQEKITQAYSTLSKDKDIMLIGGSGSFLHSGKYCGVAGVDVAKSLNSKVILIDRFFKELYYDYLLSAKELLNGQLLGAIFNDVPGYHKAEVEETIGPVLEREGVNILGIIPKDPLMGAIRIDDLAERLGGKIISMPAKGDQVVENFLIGTMQVENFMTHFRRQKNSAIIVGGDRSDLQLVALEGKCPCLVLTGNLYPNDIILTRSEVLEIPIIVVRDDTYTIAKKMEKILGTVKLRDKIKIKHGAELIDSSVDIQAIKQKMELV